MLYVVSVIATCLNHFCIVIHPNLTVSFWHVFSRCDQFSRQGAIIKETNDPKDTYICGKFRKQIFVILDSKLLFLLMKKRLFV